MLVQVLVACVIFVPGIAKAQTQQQMEYERQQREYRQAQERQRQEEQRLQQLQLENARRQQEESNRAARQTAPGAPGPQYPGAPVNPPSASPGAQGRASAQSTATSERRYALAGHGYFIAQVPHDWKDQLRQAPNRQPPTIVLTPASGNPFQVMITPTWPSNDRKGQSREELRAAVERVAGSAKSWALESQIPVREIQGRSGQGFYFSATERAPKRGEPKFTTTGVLRVRDFSVPFTILTYEGQESIIRQAIDLLKTSSIK